MGFIYFVVYFDGAGSSLLRLGSLWLWPVGATVPCSVEASHCSNFSRCGAGALDCRLRSCGARASLLGSTWNLLGPGIEPVSLALAGGFLNHWTTREVLPLDVRGIHKRVSV